MLLTIFEICSQFPYVYNFFYGELIYLFQFGNMHSLHSFIYACMSTWFCFSKSNIFTYDDWRLTKQIHFIVRPNCLVWDEKKAIEGEKLWKEVKIWNRVLTQRLTYVHLNFGVDFRPLLWANNTQQQQQQKIASPFLFHCWFLDSGWFYCGFKWCILSLLLL